MTPESGAGSAAPDPRVLLRRKDRGRDDAWIRDFLRRATWGSLATVDGTGQPYLNSNLFVFDEERHAIYLHTARTGRTRDNVEGDGRVAFSVASMGRLLPAAEALEFSVEYAGVVVFGRCRVVEDDGEAARALQRLLDKYAPHLRPGRDYRPVQPEELKRTAVYRLDIEAWSGKEKAADPDAPGAYTLPRPEYL